MPVSPFIVQDGFCKAQPVDPGNDLFQFWFQCNEQEFKKEVGDERLTRTSTIARQRFNNLPKTLKEEYVNALKQKRAKFVNDMKEWLENFKEQRIERRVTQKKRTIVTNMQREAANPKVYSDSEYSTEVSSHSAPEQNVSGYNPKQRNAPPRNAPPRDAPTRFPRPEQVPILPGEPPKFVGPQDDGTPEEDAAMEELYKAPLGYRRSVMKAWKIFREELVQEEKTKIEDFKTTTNNLSSFADISNTNQKTSKKNPVVHVNMPINQPPMNMTNGAHANTPKTKNASVSNTQFRVAFEKSPMNAEYVEALRILRNAPPHKKRDCQREVWRIYQRIKRQYLNQIQNKPGAQYQQRYQPQQQMILQQGIVGTNHSSLSSVVPVSKTNQSLLSQSLPMGSQQNFSHLVPVNSTYVPSQSIQKSSKFRAPRGPYKKTLFRRQMLGNDATPSQIYKKSKRIMFAQQEYEKKIELGLNNTMPSMPALPIKIGPKLKKKIPALNPPLRRRTITPRPLSLINRTTGRQTFLVRDGTIPPNSAPDPSTLQFPTDEECLKLLEYQQDLLLAVEKDLQENLKIISPTDEDMVERQRLRSGIIRLTEKVHKFEKVAHGTLEERQTLLLDYENSLLERRKDYYKRSQGLFQRMIGRTRTKVCQKLMNQMERHFQRKNGIIPQVDHHVARMRERRRIARMAMESSKDVVKVKEELKDDNKNIKTVIKKGLKAKDVKPRFNVLGKAENEKYKIRQQRRIFYDRAFHMRWKTYQQNPYDSKKWKTTEEHSIFLNEQLKREENEYLMILSETERHSYLELKEHRANLKSNWSVVETEGEIPPINKSPWLEMKSGTNDENTYFRKFDRKYNRTNDFNYQNKITTVPIKKFKPKSLRVPRSYGKNDLPPWKERGINYKERKLIRENKIKAVEEMCKKNTKRGKMSSREEKLETIRKKLYEIQEKDKLGDVKQQGNACEEKVDAIRKKLLEKQNKKKDDGTDTPRSDASAPKDVKISKSGSKTPKDKDGTKTPKNGTKTPKGKGGAKTPKDKDGLKTPKSGSKTPKDKDSAKTPKDKDGTKTPKDKDSAKTPKDKDGTKTPKDGKTSKNDSKSSKEGNKKTVKKSGSKSGTASPKLKGNKTPPKSSTMSTTSAI